MIVVGDCREVLAALPANSVDSIVTDPPYHLTSVVKRFGKESSVPAKHGSDGLYQRQSKGFMGQTWDGGDIAFQPALWIEALRVLKPGGHMVAFGGSRTYHRMACAIEDAGFEIRDQIMWLYGSGFPKSHDVSKGIDKRLGADRAVVSESAPVKRMIPGADQERSGWIKDNGREFIPTVTTAGSPEAAQWEGWGTALKPAHEPITLARKPLTGTVADNVLINGTGALNIDGCRVGKKDTRGKASRTALGLINDDGWNPKEIIAGSALGRWPANLIHDGSDEVLEAFPLAPGQQGDLKANTKSRQSPNGIFGGMRPALDHPARNDSGSAARFFYCAKASKSDREEGNLHPTVKPTDLMRYLCRLITPPGGTVLDMFCGSGSTGKAAHLEQFRFIGIEMDQTYADIAAKRAITELIDFESLELIG